MTHDHPILRFASRVGAAMALAMAPLFALPVAASEGPYIVWERTFGGSEDDRAISVAVLPDGGLAVVGNTVSKGAGGQDMWVLRLDAAGNKVWERTFGGSEDDTAISVVVLPDGGLAVAGWTESKGAGGADMWVLRLDAAGGVIWERTYGGSEADGAFSVVALADGGLAVAGWTESKGAGGADIWVLRLDGAGNVVWERTFAGSEADVATSVAVLPGGGLAVAGWTESKGPGGPITHTWVMRLDDAGKVVWERTYGGSKQDGAFSVVALPDGGLAVAGNTEFKGVAGEPPPLGADDPFARFGRPGFSSYSYPMRRVLRLDAAGGVIWERTFGRSEDDAATSVAVLPDGGLAVAGATESKGGRDADMWVMRFDSAGNIVWERTFGGSEDDWAVSVVVLPDGGLAVAGTTESKGAGGADMWVLRLEGDGQGAAAPRVAHAAPALAPAPAQVALAVLDEDYVVIENATVREQPNIASAWAGRLLKGEIVTALGKVADAEWYLVAKYGEPLGYVFAPLLAPEGSAEAFAAVAPGGMPGPLPAVLAILDHALALADGVSDVYDRAPTLSTIAGAQAEAGDRDGALRTISAAIATAKRFPNVAAYLRTWDALRRNLIFEDIAAAQAKTGDVEGALRTVEGISDAKSLDITLGLVAVTLVKTGDFDGALRTVERISDASQRAWPLAEIAQAQAKARDVEGALRTAERISKAGSRDSALIKIAVVQAEAGDVEGALNTAARISGADDRAFALAGIAGAQADAGAVAGALTTAMGVSDGRNRVSALLRIAKAQEKAGDAAGARRTTHAAVAAAEGILDADRDNIGTPGAAQRANVLVWIAEAQTEAGDVDAAQRTIIAAVAAAEQIPEGDRTRSLDERSRAFSNIAGAQAGAGDVEGAFRTAERIPSYLDAGGTLSNIAEGQAKAGDVEGALRTAEGISNPYARGSAFEEIAVTQIEAGDVEGARRTLQAAVATAERIPLAYGSNRTSFLVRIALAQAKAGDVEGALRTAERVPEANGRAKVLARITIALVQADRAAGRRQAAK